MSIRNTNSWIELPQLTWWHGALLTFGVGDVLTTVVFLSTGMNFEGNPVAQDLLGHGLWILPVWKAGVLAAFYALYRAAPRTARVGIPLGLTLLGTLITAWNTFSSLTGTRIYL